MKKILSILALAGTLSACGISSAPPEDDYSASSVYGTQEVLKVTIVSKRRVKVASNKTTGKLGGAVIGGAIGDASAGGSNGEKAVGAIVGAIAGSVIGEAIEGNVNQYFATEYVIEDATGELQAVIVKDNYFNVGDKAFLILSDRPVLRKRN